MEPDIPGVRTESLMEEVVTSLRLLADATRLRLALLLHDRDATVSELAARLGLPQPRVSTHLALLRDAGLVVSQRAGRQRVYHLDAARVGPLLSAVEALLSPGAAALQPVEAALPSAQAARLVRRDAPIRHARTCYDHLAGVAGVRLLDELRARGWLAAAGDGGSSPLRLTAAGATALGARGVDVTAARRARRQFAFACLDWTERRPHLGGALAAAILRALRDAGFVQQAAGSRTVFLQTPLDGWLEGADPS
jgi:DNA-binding transcriptional ArsR family regulator